MTREIDVPLCVFFLSCDFLFFLCESIFSRIFCVCVCEYKKLYRPSRSNRCFGIINSFDFNSINPITQSPALFFLMSFAFFIATYIMCTGLLNCAIVVSTARTFSYYFREHGWEKPFIYLVFVKLHSFKFTL